MSTDVLIVGGGLSGLALADHLHRAGLSFQLVEARRRLGGRIKAVQSGQAMFDLGPSWFWPGQPRMAALAKRLGLEVFEQYAQGAVCFEDANGTVQRGMSGHAMAGSLRVGGGMAALIDGLAASLPPGAIRRAARVTEVAQGSATLDTGEAICADTIILALPPRVAATLRFSTPLSAAQMQALHAIPTWMGGQAKFVATYKTAFWRDAGLSGDMMSRHGPMAEVHDASPARSGPYALFGFVGIPAPHRQGQEAALKDAALAQLARAFGPDALKPLTATLQDWAFAPDTASPLDHQPLGHHPDYGLPRELAHIWGGQLRLGSTEVAPQFGGFLEGALAVADRLAAELGATGQTALEHPQ